MPSDLKTKLYRSPLNLISEMITDIYTWVETRRTMNQIHPHRKSPSSSKPTKNCWRVNIIDYQSSTCDQPNYNINIDEPELSSEEFWIPSIKFENNQLEPAICAIAKPSLPGIIKHDTVTIMGDILTVQLANTLFRPDPVKFTPCRAVTCDYSLTLHQLQNEIFNHLDAVTNNVLLAIGVKDLQVSNFNL